MFTTDHDPVSNHRKGRLSVPAALAMIASSPPRLRLDDKLNAERHYVDGSSRDQNPVWATLTERLMMLLRG